MAVGTSPRWSDEALVAVVRLEPLVNERENGKEGSWLLLLILSLSGLVSSTMSVGAQTCAGGDGVSTIGMCVTIVTNADARRPTPRSRHGIYPLRFSPDSAMTFNF